MGSEILPTKYRIINLLLLFFINACKQKKLISQKDLEREAGLKHSVEELENKKNEVLLLENRVKDLEQRLQLADAKLKEKVSYILPLIYIQSKTS